MNRLLNYACEISLLGKRSIREIHDWRFAGFYIKIALQLWHYNYITTGLEIESLILRKTRYTVAIIRKNKIGINCQIIKVIECFTRMPISNSFALCVCIYHESSKGRCQQRTRNNTGRGSCITRFWFAFVLQWRENQSFASFILKTCWLYRNVSRIIFLKYFFMFQINKKCPTLKTIFRKFSFSKYLLENQNLK